jgi:predicted regulator of Ras-like GTPase activity (Roadblock/LC7/MglB family)
MSLAGLLGELTRAHGVRGALVVSREDGLPVAEALMEDLDGRALAALAASLDKRLAALAAALGQTQPAVWELAGTEAVLLAAAAAEGLLLVVVAAPDAGAGELRLRLRRAAEQAA